MLMQVALPGGDGAKAEVKTAKSVRFSSDARARSDHDLRNYTASVMDLFRVGTLCRCRSARRIQESGVAAG